MAGVNNSPRPASRGRLNKPPRIPLTPIIIPEKTEVPPNLPQLSLTINGGKYTCTSTNDLQMIEHLGSGAYGVVAKYRHMPSDQTMAVKRITYTSTGDEQKKQLIELDVSMRSTSCPYTVGSYGALFQDGDVWICMELMDTSLDKFYPLVYGLGRTLPEEHLAHVAFSVVSALHYLKSNLDVIHRDVKPSNILANRQGQVKLCDFGISGMLVDSMAGTNVGSRPYMAPERINPPPEWEGGKKFTIKSDVWSLGVSLVELSIGRFPYNSWKTLFQQLSEVVNSPPPKLPAGKFSSDYEHFIACCLRKEVEQRCNYTDLLATQYLVTAKDADTDMGAFVREILDSKTDRKQH